MAKTKTKAQPARVRAKRSSAVKTVAKAKGQARSKPAAAPATGTDPLRAVEQLLYHQAECLDGRNWQGFIDLFTEDGLYWVPASPEQTTGDGVPSIFYEDRDLMGVRLRRLGHPRAWSQKTEWGTNHVVSNVVVEKQDPKTGDVVARSRFHMMEFRNDTTRHFAGSYIHHLKKTQDGYRIKLQRVDMVNAQGPYDYVLQAWV
jgi:benzoate/toluate 1,2-dioxygenase beta subunit